MPNEMQLIETDGTPKHEMQKRALISDGGITRPTLIEPLTQVQLHSPSTRTSLFEDNVNHSPMLTSKS